ncbi:MAG: hypothetical protein KF693_13920, partial [Nitrospira sp.]|nr:hypothetical protein [Nitrospira sp.]
GVFLYGNPLWVSREADEASLEEARQELETVLNRLTDDAERAVTRQPPAIRRDSQTGRSSDSPAEL